MADGLHSLTADSRLSACTPTHSLPNFSQDWLTAILPPQPGPSIHPLARTHWPPLQALDDSLSAPTQDLIPGDDLTNIAWDRTRRKHFHCCLRTDRRENSSSFHCSMHVRCQGNASTATSRGNGWFFSVDPSGLHRARHNINFYWPVEECVIFYVNKGIIVHYLKAQ
jgi:hypothetical protein